MATLLRLLQGDTNEFQEGAVLVGFLEKVEILKVFGQFEVTGRVAAAEDYRYGG